eukprot:m.523379 g.523379  ORF g.523379 m.523379 type:complete len:169 (+) comp57523_c0_seq17:1870-2376(+)
MAQMDTGESSLAPGDSSSRRRTTSFVDEQNKTQDVDDQTPTGMTVTQTSEGTKITTVVVHGGGRDNSPRELSYVDTKVIGNGSFGLVFQSKLVATGEPVAIKKVLQDPRFKNRELQIMRMLNHRNVIELKYYFYSAGAKVPFLFLRPSKASLDFLPLLPTSSRKTRCT